MEKQIKDGLNFVLGAVALIKEESAKLSGNLEKDFSDLAVKGSQDTSEVSVNLRKYLSEGFESVGKVVTETNKAIEDLKSKITTTNA